MGRGAVLRLAGLVEAWCASTPSWSVPGTHFTTVTLHVRRRARSAVSVMCDDLDEARDLGREREDELIRQYLLAEATAWAEYERKYRWIRTPPRRAGAGSER